MNELINKGQAAFLHGQVIINDNIILSHELVKGYGRKEISPICMLEIDMQKSYDSLEWVFLEQVLIGLNFPENFVKWIMICVKIISYSIIVNCKATTPFCYKKKSETG